MLSMKTVLNGLSIYAYCSGRVFVYIGRFEMCVCDACVCVCVVRVCGACVCGACVCGACVCGACVSVVRVSE